MNEDPKLNPYESGILDAITEFRDVIAESKGKSLERHYTVRQIDLKLQPDPYDAEDVKTVRALLGWSQTLFARYIGSSVATVRSWEQGKRPPSPMACRFMDELAADPEHTLARLKALSASSAGPKKGPKNVPVNGHDS